MGITLHTYSGVVMTLFDSRPRSVVALIGDILSHSQGFPVIAVSVPRAALGLCARKEWFQQRRKRNSRTKLSSAQEGTCEWIDPGSSLFSLKYSLETPESASTHNGKPMQTISTAVMEEFFASGKPFPTFEHLSEMICQLQTCVIVVYSQICPVRSANEEILYTILL